MKAQFGHRIFTEMCCRAMLCGRTRHAYATLASSAGDTTARGMADGEAAPALVQQLYQAASTAAAVFIAEADGSNQELTTVRESAGKIVSQKGQSAAEPVAKPMPSTASLKCSGKTETEPSKSDAGAVISHRFANVARTVCEVMDRFTLHDLGVDVQHAASSLRLFRGHISTQTVYSSDLFEIVAFFFPARSAIPLHDHPGMTVFSKVIYGSLTMESYDWVDQPSPTTLDEWSNRLEAAADRGDFKTATTAGACFAARQRADTILTPEAPTFILKPDFANIHAFSALSDTVVLDVLMPPYDEEGGRDCHYFEKVGARGRPGSVADVAQLRITSAPDWLVIKGSEYRGPRAIPAIQTDRRGD